MYFPAYRALRKIGRAGRPSSGGSTPGTELEERVALAAFTCAGVALLIFAVIALIIEISGSDMCWAYSETFMSVAKKYCLIEAANNL